MIRKVSAAVFAVAAACLGSQAQAAGLFSAPSGYSIVPFTQAPGTVTNNLVLADTLTGFNVTGQFIVNVPAGNFGGLLLSWEVKRALDPSYTPAANFTTTSALTGFISAPVGNVAAAGSLSTDFTLTGGSTAAVNINYAGSGVFNYNVSNSTTFFYTPAGANFMRQNYFVDFNYNGPGGQYIVDFPAESSAGPVPEPASLAMLGTGAGMVFLRRRRSR